ncbi:reverse transcriptase family protein [Actinobacillus capsulatus]|uniref:reverse transcriptase family protein n=1 Tax=Actinobacillus capsulatus TaxID=717 RepID=UPI000375E573|nr:reverse transcriptase family protein [Actinobacillus capsulatus]
MAIHKRHTLQTSPLYGLKHLHQLQHLLYHSRYFRNTNIDLDKQYKLSETAHREVFYPDDTLYNFHSELNKFLSKIEKPEFIKSGKKGESYLTHVSSHINKNQYFSLDIRSYYSNINRLDVFKFFRNNLGCSHKIANYLAYFCTYKDQLPLGSPMSMNLAYFINEPMFYCLNEIAVKNNLSMTVYVDDIAFSGRVITSKVKYDIIGVINKHGYSINEDKLRFYKSKKTYRETSGLLIYKGKLLPNKEKLDKLHKMLSEWDALLRLDKPLETKNHFIRLISFISYLCQIDTKYMQLKYKVIKEYNNKKEGDLLAIYQDRITEWNTLLSNHETSFHALNEKHAELNELIKNLSKLNKKHLILYKQIKYEHEKFKKHKRSSIGRFFSAFSKYLA